MDFTNVRICCIFSIGLISLILLDLESTKAEFYTINDHHIPASKSSPGGSAALPVSAHSQTECILKWRNKAGGKNLQPFYSNQNECFCLKEDQQKGKGINGSLFVKVSKVAFIIAVEKSKFRLLFVRQNSKISLGKSLFKFLHYLVTTKIF